LVAAGAVGHLQGATLVATPTLLVSDSEWSVTRPAAR